MDIHNVVTGADCPVRVDRTKYQIQIPLPPKIDASVTMMQVEEKPDVTYSDVGGCKEQIEKLREVVETPLLSVRPLHAYIAQSTNHWFHSLNATSVSVSTHQKVSSFSALQEQERPFAPVPSQTEQMQPSSV